MRSNRWTAPLVAVALLAPGAMVLGWNAPELASAAARPWTSDQAAELAPGLPVPEQEPTAAPELGAIRPVMEPSGSSPSAPRTTSTATRTVVLVHKTTSQTVEDRVSTTPSDTPSPDTGDKRGTDSGAPPLDGPVAPSDPSNPNTPTVATVTTPDGTELADGQEHEETDEDGHCNKYYNRGGELTSGNCPPKP